jgi:alkanesulfonate monooxygenase SsuD/methylene tetrahydromethanopterin reductase-like flavin-dependent oxidoreductase (luciferase family)
MDQAVQGFREAYSRIGVDTDLGENLAIGFHFHIAETKEQAMKEVGQFYEENLKMFGPLRLVKALSDEQIDAMGRPETAVKAGLPTIEDAVESGGVLAGPAELIIEQLKALEDKYPGLDRVSVSHPVGTPKSVIIEQLERFSEEVMPAFKVSAPEMVSGD